MVGPIFIPMYSFAITNVYEFNYFMEMRSHGNAPGLKFATLIIELDFHCGNFEHDNFDATMEKKGTRIFMSRFMEQCVLFDNFSNEYSIYKPILMIHEIGNSFRSICCTSNEWEC